MSKRKNNKEKNDKLLTICMVVSIILCIFSVFMAFFCDEYEFFYLLLFLLCVWMKDTFKSLYGLFKMSKFVMIFLFIILIVFINREFIYNKIIPIKYDLSEFFDEYCYRDNILVYNDNIYYNVFELRKSFFNFNYKYYLLQNSINSVNLNQTDNKVLCKNLKYKDFLSSKMTLHFIRDNDLYFSYAWSNSILKINLSNCKISKLINDYEFINDPGNDTVTYMFSDYKNSFIKYDISNNKVIKKVKVPFVDKNFIIDYSNFDVYGISREYNYDDDYKISNLYMNNKLLYTMEGHSLELLLLTNKYLFLYDKANIYQMDLSNYEIVNKMDNKYSKYGSLKRVFSDTNDNYFVSADGIYRYNEENNNFEIVTKILSGCAKSNYYVYHYGNKLVFDDGVDIVVYDTISNKSQSYKNVYYNYDNGILSVVFKNPDTKKVVVDKISCF